VRLEPGTTKNRGRRAFPLIPALGALLEHRHDVTRLCERAQGRFIPWVFHRNGRPIKSIARAWRTAYFVGGLDGIRTRDLWIDSGGAVMSRPSNLLAHFHVTSRIDARFMR